VVSAVAAIAMTAITAAGITFRIRRKRLPLAWDTVGVVLTYLFATYVLFTRPLS
jgi:hypothetical protein